MTDFGRRAAAAAANVLPKTGITTSYRDGDDGYYEAGWVGTRWTDNGNGTLTDNATGLMWPDDANGLGGNSGAVLSWNDAIDYAEGLTYATHTDWKMPNFYEIITILDLTTAPFTINALIANADTYTFWTSTHFPGDTTSAWIWAIGFRTMFQTPKSSSFNLICCRDA